MKTNLKTAGWSTKGWIVFVTSEDRYVCINAEDIKDRNNYNQDTYSWVANDLRVFTPVKIEGNSEMIVINFTEEKRIITAKVINLPEDYKDKKCVEYTEGIKDE